MHSRSLETIGPRIPTMSGRSSVGVSSNQGGTAVRGYWGTCFSLGSSFITGGALYRIINELSRRI